MCTNVMAEWTKLANTLDAKAVVYADTGKIRNEGMSKVKMRHLIDYCNKEMTSSGRVYQSRTELIEYDWVNEHYRILAASQYAWSYGERESSGFQ